MRKHPFRYDLGKKKTEEIKKSPLFEAFQNYNYVDYALDTYLLSDVLMISMSPSLTNNGT